MIIITITAGWQTVSEILGIKHKRVRLISENAPLKTNQRHSLRTINVANTFSFYDLLIVFHGFLFKKLFFLLVFISWLQKKKQKIKYRVQNH